MASNHSPGHRYFFKHPASERNLNRHHWPLFFYPRKAADFVFKLRVELTDLLTTPAYEQVNSNSSHCCLCGASRRVCCLIYSEFLTLSCLDLWISDCKGGINLSTVYANTSLGFQTQQFGYVSNSRKSNLVPREQSQRGPIRGKDFKEKNKQKEEKPR